MHVFKTKNLTPSADVYYYVISISVNQIFAASLSLEMLHLSSARSYYLNAPLILTICITCKSCRGSHRTIIWRNNCFGVHCYGF